MSINSVAVNSKRFIGQAFVQLGKWDLELSVPRDIRSCVNTILRDYWWLFELEMLVQ